ncbi:hypothetical protein DSO57_1032423 [Entomophthora muscae]|uniref:Uncharacterized protein n=1 Tax=Entomophthora muscae TaxID=34485 RepID=A0ACC2TCE1_9FUNG|nr:hypothetical protein DSO57_1032423 [Entomophthora muscae]
MQTLSGYKFKYKFVKGELNILLDLLCCNPAMYPVRSNEDPQVTVIPESLILPDSASSLPQTPHTPPAASPQLLVLAPATSPGLDPPTGPPQYAPAQHSGGPARLSGWPGHLCKAVTQLCF